MKVLRRDTVTQLYPYPFNGWVTVSLLKNSLASISLHFSTCPPPPLQPSQLCVPPALRKLGEVPASLCVHKGSLTPAPLFPVVSTSVRISLHQSVVLGPGLSWPVSTSELISKTGILTVTGLLWGPGRAPAEDRDHGRGSQVTSSNAIL